MSETCDVQVGMATIQRAIEINPNQSRGLLTPASRISITATWRMRSTVERQPAAQSGKPQRLRGADGVATRQMALGRFAEALATAEHHWPERDYVRPYWMLARLPPSSAAS